MKSARKLFLLLLIFSISICCLSGCKKSELDKNKPVTLTMWHVYGEQADSPMNRLIDEFNETVGMEKGIIINVTAMSNASKIGEKLLDAEWNVIFRRVMYYCICADLQSVRKERDSVQFGSCLSVFHIEIRLHVRQQTGPGHEIHLQNVVRQRRDGGKIPSVQMCTLFHNLFYR